MNRKLVDKIMNALLTTSVLLILAGTMFKVQHWPHGEIIQRAGFVFGFILGALEIRRLKRVIRDMDETTHNAE